MDEMDFHAIIERLYGHADEDYCPNSDTLSRMKEV